MSTAVRQTPLTATLAPSCISSSTRRHCRRMRWPATATAPTSSMIPVNILFKDVRFHSEFVGRDGMQSHTLQLDGIGTSQAPGSTGHRQRLQAAQNFWSVIEKDLVDDTRFQNRPIQLASRFDHQRAVL